MFSNTNSNTNSHSLLEAARQFKIPLMPLWVITAENIKTSFDICYMTCNDTLDMYIMIIFNRIILCVWSMLNHSSSIATFALASLCITLHHLASPFITLHHLAIWIYLVKFRQSALEKSVVVAISSAVQLSCLPGPPEAPGIFQGRIWRYLHTIAADPGLHSMTPWNDIRHHICHDQIALYNII